MSDATPLPFDLPAVARKKLTIDFDGGNQSSDAGVLLLRAAEAKIGVVERMAAALPDPRDQSRITHTLEEIIAARVFGICCGYEDGIDHNALRSDPALKMAVGRHPETGCDLASQSTISRFENAPTKKDAAKLAGALVDHFTAQVEPGYRDVFDIDDSFHAAYGGQQLAFWNAHHDERGFASMHVYHAGTGLPVATILRPAKTPGGKEVRTVVKHLTKRILKSWDATCDPTRSGAAGREKKRANIVWRGDSHYSRTEALDWCDDNGVGYVFGLAGNSVLAQEVAELSDHLRFWHALSDAPKSRCYTSFWHQAGSWSRPRRVIARIEASMQPDPTPTDPDAMRQEIDVRYVVTTLDVDGALRHDGDAERIYEGVYCQRGQAENLIKLHKAQLASDRTSCTSAIANQIRLNLTTAAFWLMHTVRSAIPEGHALAKAEFNTIRLRLLKIAVRVVEHASRIRAHLPTSMPDKALFRSLALGLSPSG
jgi:Transposase DDE domain group 1